MNNKHFKFSSDHSYERISPFCNMIWYMIYLNKITLTLECDTKTYIMQSHVYFSLADTVKWGRNKVMNLTYNILKYPNGLRQRDVDSEIKDAFFVSHFSQ